MKSLALFFLLVYTSGSLGDDDGRFGERSNLRGLKRKKEMGYSDLGEEVKSEFSERAESFHDSSVGERNMKQTMAEKRVIDPEGLSIDEGEEEILEEHPKAGHVSKKKFFKPAPSRGIPMDLNLRQVKDLLEGAMGFGCDDGKVEEGPIGEAERELILYCGFSKVRCMPENANFPSKANNVANKPCCGPFSKIKKRKDMDMQVLQEMMNEMSQLPCDGGQQPMAQQPVLFCGVGKMRRLRRKHRKHCEGSDVPSKTSCSRVPQRHKPSDLDLKLLDRLISGILDFPCKDRNGWKSNKLETKMLRFCGIGKMRRLSDPSNHNCTPSAPFNRALCSCGQNLQCPADLDFQEVNDLMEEVVAFAGKKEKKGVKTEDFQDWVYGYCGLGKFTRLTVNSCPHHKTIHASHKTTCNPLEGPEEYKQKLLRKLDVYLAGMVGFDCKDGKEEEVVTSKALSPLYELCIFGRVLFMPENYFLDRSTCGTSKPSSCCGKPNLGNPSNLTLSQLSVVLEEILGIPEGGTVAEVGGGLYLYCGVTRVQVLPDPLDIRQSSWDVSERNPFFPHPIV